MKRGVTGRTWEALRGLKLRPFEMRLLYPKEELLSQPGFPPVQLTPQTAQPSEIDVLVSDDVPHGAAVGQSSTSSLQSVGPRVRYYAGGLPALCAAARYLEEGGREPVVYVTDGNTPQSMFSGHHAHLHPTEYSSHAMTTGNLIRTLLRGLGVLRDQDPVRDLAHYSYLHFDVGWRELLMHPMRFTAKYGSFFVHRLMHDVFAKDNASADDRWLSLRIAESFAFHESLSRKIEAKYGKPTFSKGGRYYYSEDAAVLRQRFDAWKACGIQVFEQPSRDDIAQRTYLRDDATSSLSLFQVGEPDGKFFPYTPEMIIRYLKDSYPQQFDSRVAQVRQVVWRDEASADSVHSVVEAGGRVVPVSYFLGSTGHNRVYFNHPSTGARETLWNETPVAGSTALWRVEFPLAALLDRYGLKDPADPLLRQRMEHSWATANLSNLHVTPWSVHIDLEKGVAKQYVRCTQGANFDKNYARASDVLNMAQNLAEYFDGEWDLLTLGSCTRKTGIANVPSYRAGFVYGYSGVGYSLSATRIEDIQKYSAKPHFLRIMMHRDGKGL